MEFGVRMALKAITNTAVVLEATMVSNVIVIVTRTEILVHKNVGYYKICVHNVATLYSNNDVGFSWVALFLEKSR
jgi:hypothetical protein